MMYMKGKKRFYGVILTFFVFSVFLVLSGCGKKQTGEFKPTENSIYIKRDGTLESAIISGSQQTYYNVDALKAFVQKEIDEYNVKKGAQAVSIVSAEINNNIIKLILSYSDANSMIEFAQTTQDDTLNITSVSIMSMKDAQAAGLTQGLSPDAAKKKSAYIAVIDGTGYVYTEGKILFAEGSAVTKTSDFTVNLGGGRSYIVFE